MIAEAVRWQHEWQVASASWRIILPAELKLKLTSRFLLPISSRQINNWRVQISLSISGVSIVPRIYHTKIMISTMNMKNTRCLLVLLPVGCPTTRSGSAVPRLLHQERKLINLFALVELGGIICATEVKRVEVLPAAACAPHILSQLACGIGGANGV